MPTTAPATGPDPLLLLQSAEYRENQAAAQFEQARAQSLAQHDELKQHHQEILKSLLDAQAAEVGRLEQLRQQALARADYIRKNDAKLYQQALDWHQQQVDQQGRNLMLAKQRAARLAKLRTGLQALPADRRAGYVQQHAAEMAELGVPAPNGMNGAPLPPFPAAPAGSAQ